MRFGLEITATDVKAEAERRIVDRYPLWKQINIMREGGEDIADMTAFIDGVRAASNKLELQKIIPADFRDDRHWQ